MAKKATKEVIAPATSSITPTNNPTVQSTLEETVQLPCAREYFFTYSRRAWGYCLDQLPLFFGESDRFTEAFIEAQIELIDAAELLPDNNVRVSEASAAREVLLAYAQQVRSNAKRLGTIIDYAYKDSAVAAVQRTTAGLTAFSGISTSNWGGYESFINKADTYLTDNAASLVAAMAMKADFPTAFSAVGTSFKLARKTFNDKENLAKMGTKALNDALKDILKELNPMLELGKEIFEFDATNRKLFTSTDLVNEVRGMSPAGLAGYVRNANGKGIKDVLVQVENQPDKFATTDKKGRYELSLAKGSFNFIYSMAGMETQVFARSLKAGVTSRQNVVLLPVPVPVVVAPMVEEAPSVNKEATASPSISEPVSSSPLANAVSEMLAKAGSNGKANGVGM